MVDTTHAKSQEVQIDSEYAIVYNLNDDRIVYEKQVDKKMYPASMTKMMTTLVAIEAMKEDSTFTIQKEALIGLKEANASVAGFQEGEQVTYTDLLYGILLPSGADATKALAIAMFKSEEAMVAKMNEKAKALGMENTHFMNTSGLHDDNHYSTVKDMAILLKSALQNKLFKQIFCAKYYTTSNQRLTFYSTLQTQAEKYNLDVSMIQGAKTGFTLEASLCLASYAQIDGEEYIMVSAHPKSEVLLSDTITTPAYHILDAQIMYSYLAQNYKRVEVIKKGQEIAKINMRYAGEDSYLIYAQQSKSLLLNTKQQETLKVVFTPYESMFVAPMYPLSYVGEIEVYSDNEVLYSQEIQMSEKIQKDKISYYSRHVEMLLYDFRYLIVVVCIGVIALLSYGFYEKNKKSK